MNGYDDRGPWYLLTGLVIGVVLGLAYAWSVQPVRYTDTTPDTLRSDFKDQYRALIAAAYLGNADLTRARARLELLADEDMYRALTEQAQRTLAENGSDREARALGVLAVALGQSPPGPGQAVTQPGSAITRPAQVSPVPSATSGEAPTDAPTLLPSSTSAPTVETPAAETPAAGDAPAASLAAASPTPGAARPTLAAASTSPFSLLSQEKLCAESLAFPEFRIEALDRFNNPVAGVQVIITWPDGRETFSTGLKPEKGPGYADFSPQPGVLYTVQLGENGAPVPNLAAEMCPQSAGAPTWGALLLRFVQP